MRPVEIADRDLMGDDAAEPFPWKPGMEMKGRRLDLEGWFTQFRKIEIDRMIWSGANRGWDAGKHREGGTVNMAGSNQLHARMRLDDGSQFPCVWQILAIHLPDPGLERRMVQEQQRRPIRRG